MCKLFMRVLMVLNICFLSDISAVTQNTKLLHGIPDLFKLSPIVGLVDQHVPLSFDCKSQSMQYLDSLNNFEEWAIKMYDSSGKLSDGFLRGNHHFVGDYDTCVHISDEKPDGVRGKYCLAHFQINSNANTHNGIKKILAREILLHMNANETFYGFAGIRTANDYTNAFCIPAACSYHDMQIYLRTLLQPYSETYGLDIHVTVPKEECVVENPVPLTTAVYLFYAVIGLLVSCSIVGSIYDIYFCNLSSYGKETCIILKIIIEFSFYRTYTSLSRGVNNKNCINCTHGIQFFGLLAMYMQQIIWANISFPIHNQHEYLSIMENPLSMFSRSFTSLSDILVVLSGMCTSYAMVAKLEDSEEISYRSMYVRRYLKFGPLLALIILLLNTSGHFMASGSNQLRAIVPQTQLCQGYNIWKSLTFINNFDGLDEMCYMPAHQVYLDFQLFVLAPFVIMLMYRYRKHSYKIIFGMIFLLTLYKGATIYVHKLPTVFYSGMTVREMDRTTRSLFINPILRSVPYIFGIGLGYHLRITKSARWNITHRTVVIVWFIAVFGALWSLFYLVDAIRPGYQYNVLDHTIFGMLQPIFWSFAVCWITYACETGHGPKLNAFLGSIFFRRFSVMSYPFYIMQNLVIFYYLSLFTVPTYKNPFTSILDLNVLALTIACAIMATLLIIIPTRNLIQKFSHAGERGVMQEHQVNDENDKDK